MAKYNWLRQDIVIFYYNKEWAVNLFKQIIDDLPEEVIKRSILTSMEIYLIDDSKISFCQGRESSCGRRCKSVFIQPGIDYTFYRECIKPCANLNRNPVYLIETLDDFKYPLKLADDYYSEKYDGKRWKIKRAERELDAAYEEYYYDQYNP